MEGDRRVVSSATSGGRRGITPTIRRELRRRGALEAVIGHIRTDGRPDQNYLKGTVRDAINARLCGVGYPNLPRSN